MLNASSQPCPFIPSSSAEEVTYYTIASSMGLIGLCPLQGLARNLGVIDIKETTETIGLLLFAVLWALWRLLRRYLAKTDLDNLPGPESASFVTGNIVQLFNFDAWDFHNQIVEQFGRVIRIYGAFGSQHLYIFDPKAMHHIVVKDQDIYEETSEFLSMNSLSLGDGLLSTLGERHRRQRKMLNPVFSIAHMRHMLPVFHDVAKKLETAIRLSVINGAHEVDILRWMTRAALEMIGQSGLGHSFDPLVEGVEPHPYSRAVKDLVPLSFSMRFLRMYLLPTLSKIGPPWFRRLVINLMPWKKIRRLRDVINLMDQTTVRIFEEKRKALEAGDEALSKQVHEAKDIMSILMKANLAATEGDQLPDKEVLGQMSTFIFAATDTTSNALSRILYLLAKHPEVQDRLRAEVTTSRRTHGDIPYDELVALPFMDAICRETLRLFPPVPTVTRVTRRDVVLPLSTPFKGLDGREMQSLLIPNDTKVFISILNANRDPTLWGPDASEWKPECWLSPLPEALRDAHIPGIYSHLMTFLGGGQACIGFKFSQLEMKVVLSTLVSQFRFSPSDKDIFWQMSGIVTPTVKGSSLLTQLPLKVELAGTAA
ncbi:putative cytochrome P450 family protein [Lyophyllum shimeji]|uniref:Cytochrome P450 family protein n=1 Tax=Lyophyllum shimeji TaxID=47721 RepID=A0A9P3PRZ4_LYOSH|nr:putative cytochrome P450 family protein [Lyophyllum shimeji]